MYLHICLRFVYQPLFLTEMKSQAPGRTKFRARGDTKGCGVQDESGEVCMMDYLIKRFGIDTDTIAASARALVARKEGKV